MTEIYNPFTGESVEVSKAVSGPRGKDYPDRVMGASTPAIGQTRTIASLVPTGKHVSHANRLHLTRKGKRTSVGRYGETNLQRFGKASSQAYDDWSQMRWKKNVTRHLRKLNGEKNSPVKPVGYLKELKRMGVYKRDLSDLGSQPGMINPGVTTSSWSHGTPNQNFSASAGRRGSKIK